MELNWDSIKYVFQIPLKWYKKIHDKLFKAYGSNFIRIRDGYYGGMEVGIDYEDFSDTVDQAMSEKYVKDADLDSKVEDLGYVKDEDLGDLAELDTIEVDGHTSDSTGAVSFGLSSGKWLKSDSNGHITTTNDDPIAIDTTQYTPYNGTKKVISNVSWNGTKLTKKWSTWTFVNGVLIDNSATSTTEDVDTPTVVTWA